MNISLIAVGDLEQAQADLARVTKQISDPGNTGDTVSLSSQAVAMISAKDQFQTGIGLLRAAEEMEKTAITLASTEKPSS